ncbi:uncharacterized protein LOC123317491 [Coccinella septempunctata]|uniref:uncharacterized protein LOC123317491 n=1 Tax=Coccinella septempunctata TaxID=41139 RepID=UPI001D06C47B|nr:uncharacterized protein LOC123317491 [Coccinella septempunctata]
MNAIIFMVSLLGLFSSQISPTGSIWIGTKIGEIHKLIMNFATCMAHAGSFPRFDISTPEGKRLENIRADMDRLTRCSIWTVIVCGPLHHIRATYNLLMLLTENPLLITDVAASPFRCAFRLMCFISSNVPFLRCDQVLDQNPFPPLRNDFLDLPPFGGRPLPPFPPLPSPPYGVLNLEGSGIPGVPIGSSFPGSSFPGSLNIGSNFPPFGPNAVGSPFPQGPTFNGLDTLPQMPSDFSNIFNAPPMNPIQPPAPGKTDQSTTITEKSAGEQDPGIPIDFMKDMYLGMGRDPSSDSASSKKFEDSLGLPPFEGVNV